METISSSASTHQVWTMSFSQRYCYSTINTIGRVIKKGKEEGFGSKSFKLLCSSKKLLQGWPRVLPAQDKAKEWTVVIHPLVSVICWDQPGIAKPQDMVSGRGQPCMLTVYDPGCGRPGCCNSCRHNWYGNYDSFPFWLKSSKYSYILVKNCFFHLPTSLFHLHALSMFTVSQYCIDRYYFSPLKTVLRGFLSFILY